MVRNTPPVTKNLIIINTIIWVAMALSPTISANMMKYCALHFHEASFFNPLQPVTYMFLHGNFIHLLFNMFTLFMFGSTLEYVMGSKRFLIFYMVCGVGAALIQEAVWAMTLNSLIGSLYGIPESIVPEAIAHGSLIGYPESLNLIATIGASGAIYGILLGFAMLFPNRPIYIMFIPVPIKAKWMALIWGVLELSLGTAGASDGIAHFAHLGGMIFGFMLMAYWKRKGTIRGDNLW